MGTFSSARELLGYPLAKVSGSILQSWGVPDACPMMLYFDVVLGEDRTAGIYYLGDTSSNLYAEYDITGTTYNRDVHFDGVKTI